MDDFWDTSAYFTGPPLTEEMIVAAEEAVGYKLPGSYLQLIRLRNGGTPRRQCFPTAVPTCWAEDHVQVSGIPGIGGTWGIDSEDLGSRYLIGEWGYPDVGFVVGHTPTAGHDIIMLDYSQCGRQGEPQVIHVSVGRDEPEVTVLAPNFEAFVRGLVDCSRYDEAED